MDLSGSLSKRENWAAVIVLRVIKEYNWSNPEKVFIESKEGLGLDPKVHQLLKRRIHREG